MRGGGSGKTTTLLTAFSVPALQFAETSALCFIQREEDAHQRELGLAGMGENDVWRRMMMAKKMGETSGSDKGFLDSS